MMEGFYFNQSHKVSINIKENTRHALADTLKAWSRDKRAGSRGQEPWKISLGSLALRPSGEFWKVLEASPEVAAQRLGSCSLQGPPKPLHSQSKHQSLCFVLNDHSHGGAAFTPKEAVCSQSMRRDLNLHST